MTDFHLSGQVFDNKLVGSISLLLNAAGVPNVLWGFYLTKLYGIPGHIDGVSFVVPDIHVRTCFDTLHKAGFIPCKESFNCPHATPIFVPEPATHLHFNASLKILFYRKSEMLWEFPEFEIASHSDNRYIMSASDTRLAPGLPAYGQGRLPPHLSFLQILTFVRYYEAMLLLICRHPKGSVIRVHWTANLAYISQHLEETGNFDPDDLEDIFKPAYRALVKDEGNFLRTLDILRDELNRQHRLPV